MKDTSFSNCESEFVVAAIKKHKRLDGRLFDELRSIELHFGSDFGCAYVTLGETKVLAQASCELCEPRNTRKNEGNIFVNVEINDMVCGVFETGHQGHLGVHTNRLIEKCIKDSKCVDLEALCIISEEQAWEIRVDVTVLNYDGNLFTGCSLAALAALAHFRTPHVTLENGGVRVESIKEHEPEPLSLNHYPILVAFAIFGETETLLLDPTELEEKVCDSELIIGMNSFRELCGMHFSGRTTGNRFLIVKASQQAALVAVELVNLLKTKLEEDAAERKKNRGKTKGLVSAIHLDRVLSASRDRDSLRITRREIEESATSALNDTKMAVSGVDSGGKQPPSDEKDSDEEEKVTHSRDKKRGVQLPPMQKEAYSKRWVPSGNKNAWALPNATLSDGDVSEESDDGDDDDVDYVKTITDEDRIIDRIELDSEEEADTAELGAEDLLENEPERSLSEKVNVEHPLTANENREVGESSSYSMTSPSYSSNSSLGSSSSSGQQRSKPDYNPPMWDCSQPSSSKSHLSLNFPRKRWYPCYSPSSPSTSPSSDSSRCSFGKNNVRSQKKRKVCAKNVKLHRYRGSCFPGFEDPKINVEPLPTMKMKQEPPCQSLVTEPAPLIDHRELVPYSSSNSSPVYSLHVDDKSRADSGSQCNVRFSSPTFSPNSPPSFVEGTKQSPIYSPSSPSLQTSPRLPSSPPSFPENIQVSQTNDVDASASLHSTSKYPSCSPEYSPSSPSYSATSCPYSSPIYSKAIPRSRLKSSSTTPPKAISPTYTPSSPSKIMSPTYSPSSLSKVVSPMFTPSSPSKPPPSLPSSLSKPLLSPTYSPSSPSYQPSPSKVVLSPSYTPSSPSKQPPSPSCSPNFIPVSPDSSCSLSQSPSLEYSSKSPDSSPLYSPTSSRSPDYSSASSGGKVIKKRIKLQRTSSTSPGSVVSELLDVAPDETKFSDKLKVFSQCASQNVGEREDSPLWSVPSPKYSPSSRPASPFSDTGLPPYSPSSPSRPPPSPPMDPASPPSPDWSPGLVSLSGVKQSKSPEPATSRNDSSLGSPHYSLDSLSLYSSSSFSSGLPSPSSGSPRYTPSSPENDPPAKELTPSPPLSPSINLTSPRVSSSGSSTPCEQTDGPPPVINLNQISQVLPSLSMFSPSVSPELPNFSPSSPSYQPPSPTYSPSSPSYSSGSCSPPDSTSNASKSSPRSTSPPNSPTSFSSASTEPQTLVLKVFLPKRP